MLFFNSPLCHDKRMNRSNTADYLAILQPHIGSHIEHQGRHCQLIEILQQQPPILVFRCETGDKPQIQSNQHGNAARRVAETYNISLLNDTATDLHPVAKTCLPDSIHQSLREALLKA